MKKILTTLLSLICCLSFCLPSVVAIAEMLPTETSESEQDTQKTNKKEEIETSEVTESETVETKADLTEENSQFQSESSLLATEIEDHFRNFFESMDTSEASENVRIGNPRFLWQEMFAKNYVTPPSTITNVYPWENATRSFSGTVKGNYREFPWAWNVGSGYLVVTGELNALFNPHTSAPNNVTGVNKTGDISVTMSFTKGSGLANGDVSGTFRRIKDYDSNNPSSTVFTFSSVTSFMYLWRYNVPHTIVEQRNLHVSGTASNVDVDLAGFFQTKTSEPSISVKGAVIYENDSWDGSTNFVNGTGFFGEKLKFDEVKVIRNNIDTTKAGSYTGQFDYYGKRFDFTLLVMEDKSSLEVKDSQIDIGDAWTAEDNFVSATYKTGDAMSFSPANISTSGTVNTNVPGTYPVIYSSKDGFGNTLQTKTATITVNADQSTLTVKDTDITMGEQWKPQDNFVSATDKSGAELDYAAANIAISGTVDTSTAGVYPITYTSRDADDKILQTKDFNVTVVPAILEINHIDIATGNTFDSSVEKGAIGTSHPATAKTSGNYTFRYAKVNNVEIDEQEISVPFTKEKQTVNFYYNSRGGNVTVYHIEEDSGELVAEDVILSGYVSDPYSINLEDPKHKIEGYNYSKAAGNLTGEFSANDQFITLYYTRDMPKIKAVDFSFGQLSKMTTLAYAEKTQEEMTISFPKVLENEVEGQWYLSAELEKRFESENGHEISSLLTLSNLQFSGSAGSELTSAEQWQLSPGQAVPIAQLQNSREEKRQWTLQFGEENQNKMTGVSLKLAPTQAKNNTEYSSTIVWTLTTEP